MRAHDVEKDPAFDARPPCPQELRRCRSFVRATSRRVPRSHLQRLAASRKASQAPKHPRTRELKRSKKIPVTSHRPPTSALNTNQNCQPPTKREPPPDPPPPRHSSQDVFEEVLVSDRSHGGKAQPVGGTPFCNHEKASQEARQTCEEPGPRQPPRQKQASFRHAILQPLPVWIWTRPSRLQKLHIPYRSP